MTASWTKSSKTAPFMLGGNDDDVCGLRQAGNGRAGPHQRLGINLAVHGNGKYLAERANVHVGGSQLVFRGIQTGTGQIVVKAKHIDGRRKTGFEQFQLKFAAA